MRNTREQTTNEVERKKKDGRENTASTCHFKPTANYLIFWGKKRPFECLIPARKHVKDFT